MFYAILFKYANNLKNEYPFEDLKEYIESDRKYIYDALDYQSNMLIGIIGVTLLLSIYIFGTN